MNERKIYFCLLTIIILFSSCGAAKKAAIRERQVNELVYTARTYVGTPYKWGGVDRLGLDCSGLLLCSFRSIGKYLPRTSEAQEGLGKKIKIYNLQPGDLVFFATGKKKRKITHVGMVTEVKNENEVYFIHSSTSRGVVESNIFYEYYRKRFRKARRVF